MGELAAVVWDVADIRELECRLPDDLPVSQLAAQLAAAARLPSVAPDDTPVRYGFVVKGGHAIGHASLLADLDVTPPLRLRLAPELAIGSGQGSIDQEPVLPFGPDLGQVIIDRERCLVHDDGLNLPLDIRIDARAHRDIESFAARDRYAECAGLLLGDVTVERKARVANIRAIAPAVGAEEGRTGVRVTLQAWEAMLRVRDREHPSMRVLGWFHTHAGWGVFLSEMDVFVQKYFFTHPSMVAYVLDPTSGHESFFGWCDGNIMQVANYGLVGAPRATGSLGSAKRPLGIVMACAAGMAIGAGIYFGLLPALQSSPKSVAKATVRAQQPGRSVTHDRMYVIRKRDNMWLICNRFYDDGDLAPALARYNGVDSFSGLQVGQEIKLPAKEVLIKNEK